MELLLELVPEATQPDGEVAVRLLVLNDCYEPVRVDHRLLIGPNIASIPRPVSAETSLPDEGVGVVGDHRPRVDRGRRLHRLHPDRAAGGFRSVYGFIHY